MLSDRSYMRHDSARPAPGFLAWFLGALATVFVLQRVGEVWNIPGLDDLLRYGALSSSGMRAGELWTPLTYALLHGNLTHLLLNGLGLLFLGRALQLSLGSTRLAWLTVVGALGAAGAWLAFNFNRPGEVIGASGIAMAYLAVFACLQPRRPMTFLLFFIIPITMQPMWLVALVGGIDLLGLITQELPGSGSFYGVAHSAHLGGLVAGWLFHRLVIARKSHAPSIIPPPWTRKAASRSDAAYTVNLDLKTSARDIPDASAAPFAANRDSLRAEVDRILDKINQHGFGSLTDAEKRVLDEARQHLSHR